MENKEQIEKAFKEELKALLDKWGVIIEAEDHYQGYPESGEDVRMTVDIPAIYDKEGNCLREWLEIDLGKSFP